MTIYNQYKGKNVLITGHTGFKGAWLVAILHKLGAEILGYALEQETSHCIYNEIDGDSLCESVIGDIRDKAKLEKLIIEFQPDFVFHLAAQALVIKSYVIPSETFEVNVVGTANLLESLNKLTKKCTVVVVTTDKVYENNEWEYPYNENDRLGGYDPYSASKACAELVVSSFRNSFFNIAEVEDHKKAIVSVRAGNVIGGGDYSENRIIPDVINALMKGEQIVLRSPNSIRPWQHVLEPLFAYLKLGLYLSENPERFSQSFNIGPKSDDNLTVKELVQKAIAIWGSGEYVTTGDAKLHEAGILNLDISLAASLLNWAPVYDSYEAIEKTIKWYKKEDKTAITNKQIEEYLSEIS